MLAAVMNMIPPLVKSSSIPTSLRGFELLLPPGFPSGSPGRQGRQPRAERIVGHEMGMRPLEQETITVSLRARISPGFRVSRGGMESVVPLRLDLVWPTVDRFICAPEIFLIFTPVRYRFVTSPALTRNPVAVRVVRM